VLVQAPTYHGALEAFWEQAAAPLTLPARLDGLRAAVAQHRPALAYVIVTFHNPTGAVIDPLTRRTLVETCTASGVPLIDDEVLADLGFPGERVPPPLAAFGDSVISVGSLSKPSGRDCASGGYGRPGRQWPGSRGCWPSMTSAETSPPSP
jgi:DNA-binding transcriptional MocR family regulator